jgi:hypothetical protein
MPESDVRDPDPRQARRILTGLTIALAGWGIYLAIGATGAFLDSRLWDPRKSLIVITCSSGFLIFWWTILGIRARRKTAAPLAPWNWPSVLSCLVASLGLLFGWLAMRPTAPGPIDARTAWLGLIAAGTLVAAAVLALIGASNPRPQRGKLLALLTFALLLGAIILFLWRPTA